MRNVHRSALLLAVIVMMMVLSAMFAHAAPIAPTNLQVSGSSSRQLPQTSTGALDAQGGNVTQVNIDALSITKTWQGYYGNITGNIHLDDGVNQSFYVWGNGTLSGEIYASRNGTIVWSTINCTNGTQRDAEESFLGVITSDGDSVTNTFNSTSHPSFYVGLQQIQSNSCLGTNLLVNGTQSSTEFYQVLLSDNSSNLVYTSLIEDDSYAYNSQLADFQLMVGENEHDGNLGPTPYYFFIELS